MSAPVAFSQREHDDHRITALARLPMHPFASVHVAGHPAAEDVTWRVSLDGADGEWRFHLAPRPDDAPEGFWGEAFDDGAWRGIAVPGNWQLQDTGDPPLYTNIAMPFAAPIGRAPATDNPTGCYRRIFELAQLPADHDLILHFGAVDSACHVWLNGAAVGYSQDSRLPAEFDVTQLLRPGRNLLALRVPRWCDGSWLEDQDFWHMSGIQRSLCIEARPRRRFVDLAIRTTFDTFDADYRDAELAIDATVGGSAIPDAIAAAGLQVEVELCDPDGAPVWDEPRRGETLGTASMYRREQEPACAQLRCPVPAPRWWTAETPALYTLVVSLRDAQGRLLDRRHERVGFRHIELRDGLLRLNGRRLVIRGVNRHEHHPERGRAVTEADMRRDLVHMKRLNFNAVRTSHYPNDPRFYQLCDELGMYVVDEANIETHGTGATLAKDPSWAGAYLERALRMVQRDRNHPSIIAWSLGNESGCGAHHHAMAAWIRAADPSRVVQYEGGAPPPAVSDLQAPMYPGLDWVRESLHDPAEPRPFVCCEYAFARGNSSGNVWKFWQLVADESGFQGGFVWDWADKAIAGRDRDGTPIWLVGGDLGGSVDYAQDNEDPPMCGSGLLAPDLALRPGALEFKQVQAPVAVRFASGIGRLEVENRCLVRDLGFLDCRWQVLEDGAAVAEGLTPVPAIAAGASGELALDLPAIEATAGAEYHLHVSLRLRAAEVWAPAGHELVWAQAPLPIATPTPTPPEAPAAEVHTVDDHRWRCGAAELQVAAEDGALRWRHGTVGLERIGPCFWRAPTDIDRGLDKPGSTAARWRAAGLDRLRPERPRLTTRIGDDGPLAIVEGQWGASDTETAIRVRTAAHLDHAGRLHLDVEFVIPDTVGDLPRIGLTAEVLGDPSEATWFGRGPHDAYPDRKHGAAIGRWSRPLAELATPYLVGQESGGREDVRWWALHDEGGAGLLVVCDRPRHLDTLPWTADQLERASRWHELRPAARPVLHLDAAHAGLGGDNGWMPTIHPEYLVQPGTYHLRCLIAPLAAGDDPAIVARHSG